MASPANQRDGGYILALDVGTSSFHCLLVDLSARPIAAASAPIRYFTPDGCPTLAKEFDPEVAVDTLGWLTGKILNDTGTKAGDISAIGITSQRQGLVFLDRSGKEIYSGPNLDLRAVFEGAEIDEQFGAEFYLTTGHFPSLLFAPARFRWFREHCCPIYQETTTILPIAGWLAYRLTGSPVSELSLEGEAGLLDIRTRARCVDLMGKLGVPDSLLPPLSSLDVPAGVLSHHIAAEWGLDEGIPVVVAGPDAQCGLLGMGLNKGGQAGVVMGWSGALQVLTSAPLLDGKEMRTWAGCYPLEGLWVAESNLGDAGNAYRWLKDTILDDNASFEEAELLAQEASAGAEGVVAFLGPGPQSPVKTGSKDWRAVIPDTFDLSRGHPGATAACRPGQRRLQRKIQPRRSTGGNRYRPATAISRRRHGDRPDPRQHNGQRAGGSPSGAA